MNRHERKILRVDLNGLTMEYNSLSEAAKSNDTHPKQIRTACNSGKIYKTFHFSYIETVIPNEIWIDHPFLNVECSDMGRIRFRKSRISCGGKNGVKAIYLRVHIGRKWYLVHRLIAETFIENPENKPTVDHIDRNPENNRFDNLRWATRKEQANNRKDNRIQ